MNMESVRIVLEAVGAIGIACSLLAPLLPKDWRVTHWLSWFGANVRRIPARKS